MLLVHWARRAASRADCTAGRSKEIRTAMIAMTTSSSIRVKPLRQRSRNDAHDMEHLANQRSDDDVHNRQRKGRNHRAGMRSLLVSDPELVDGSRLLTNPHRGSVSRPLKNRVRLSSDPSAGAATAWPRRAGLAAE